MFVWPKFPALLISFFLLCLNSAGWAESALPWAMGDNDGTFLIMADIHFDPYADKDLVKQLAASPVEKWESILQTSKITQFAQYESDTNYPLFASALNAAASQGVIYDYALVCGDLISHEFKSRFYHLVGGDNKAYASFVTKTIQFVSDLIQQKLLGVPFYFCFGNNDSDCNDYEFYPDSPMLSEMVPHWPTLAAHPEAVKGFIHGGWYAVPHPAFPKEELVVLNDSFWSTKRHGDECGGSGEKAAKEELDWLNQILDEALKKGEKVTIETHMPPGVDSRNAIKHKTRKYERTYWKNEYLQRFLEILRAHSDILRTEFTGHTHMDDFRVLEKDGKPFMATHVCPAVSPIHFDNPAFQVMLYDKQTGDLKDMATMYLSNLDKTGNGEVAKWELEYDFDQAYQLTGYNAENLEKLTHEIDADPLIRQKFIDYYAVETSGQSPIGQDDWWFFNCAHLHLDASSYGHCPD